MPEAPEEDGIWYSEDLSPKALEFQASERCAQGEKTEPQKQLEDVHYQLSL